MWFTFSGHGVLTETELLLTYGVWWTLCN